MLLTQQLAQTAAQREITDLRIGRYSATAVLVLNPVSMCDVNHTQHHSRQDGWTRILHVAGYIFIELRATVPAEDAYSTAVLMYGEDSSHNHTFRTELYTAVPCTADYRDSALQYSAPPPLLSEHFPRHSSPSGRSGVRSGTKHSSPAAQGMVFIPLLVVC